MKKIRTLAGPTPGLSAYLAAEADEADWTGFRNHRSGASHRELRDALADQQHGLCGYCEIEIAAGRRQVEHIVPRSDPKRGAVCALDAGNMMACCLGGTRAVAGDPGQYLPSPRANMSCGQRKGNDTIPGFIDPRTLPEIPVLTRVTSDGRIEADEEACVAAGWEADGIAETVEFLGLNVERLRLAREQRWLALENAWEDHHDDEHTMREAAREELLPDNGRLRRFFTTSRSYFSEWGGERILAQHPRNWI